MKSLIFILMLCAIPQLPGDDSKVPAKMNHMQLEMMNGAVKTITTVSGNTTTFTNGAWQIKDSSFISNTSHYNNRGYLVSGEGIDKGTITISRHYWIERDEDEEIFQELSLATGDEKERKLTTKSFTSDSTLLSQTFLADEDTVATEHIEEVITTYTANGYRADFYSVEHGKKKRYMYVLCRTTGTDTAYLSYYGDAITTITNVVLEKDKAGNPLKILSYFDNDTSLTIKNYTYY